MARYTNVVAKAFGVSRRSRVVLCEGEVTIAQFNGTGYIDVDVITDRSVDYITRGLNLRFTPSAGAAVTIEEGSYE